MSELMVPNNLKLEWYQYSPERSAINKLYHSTHLVQECRDYINEVLEPMWNGRLMGNAIEVSSRQLSHYYCLAQTAAEILNIPIPKIYIRQDPMLNAMTFGNGVQSLIVLSHLLAEQLDDLMLMFVLGHEMGHIAANHVLFSNLIRYKKESGRRWNKNMEMEIMDWERKAEVTADRAGLIACQDLKTACVTLLTIAIGSRKLAEQVDLQEYIESQMLSLEYNPVGWEAQNYQSHYYIPVRLQEVISFYHSPNYNSIFLNCIGEDVEIDFITPKQRGE